jgi:hypothetical protein
MGGQDPFAQHTTGPPRGWLACPEDLDSFLTTASYVQWQA